MDSFFVNLIVAFGGGLFGAAIGTLPAFIFTGFAALAGVVILAAGGGSEMLTVVAFGPVLGPHVAFAGGAAAVAYAHSKGLLASGRDTTPSLMGLNRPDVLAVGGLFGCLGFLFEKGFQTAGLGPWTDTVALSVLLSAIIVRLAFGRKGVFGQVEPGGARFRPSVVANWLRWQETPGQILLIGISVGLISSYAALAFGPDRGGDVLGFALAAALLIFLQFGSEMPVTHHIALPAAAAAIASGSLAVGVVFGVAGAFVGELFSRVFLIHGDTHIDPPAGAIALMIFVLRVIQPAL